MLYGRGEERAAVDRLLDGAEKSRGGALVVRGAAGLGKSALLGYAAQRTAATGWLERPVLRASGIQSEAELPFAGLHQLLRPVLHLVDRLVPAQQAALRGALELGAARCGDRFLVSVAALDLLSEAAEEGPLLCLVDDAQWLDRPSADALVFAGRRLGAERIAMLFAARDGTGSAFDAGGLPEVSLGPLDAEGAAALLACSAVPLAPGVVASVAALAAGIPLALVELPASLTPDQRAGRVPLDDRLPLPARLDQMYGARLRELPAGTRTLLLVAAADETGDPTVVLGATQRLVAEAAAAGTDAAGTDAAADAADAALDSAERAGLLRIDDSGVVFRHPLVRSAAYQVAGFAARRAAHRALADTVAGVDRIDQVAWHRAAAALGPDEEVAAALERSAERAALRGGPAAAATALRRSAELTEDAATRARRLVGAADAAWRGGLHRHAVELLRRSAAADADPAVRIAAEHVRAGVEADCGDVLAAADALVHASERAAAVDATVAIRMLVEAAEAAAYAGDSLRTAELGRRAAILPVEGKPAVFMSGLLQGMGRIAEGDSASGAALLRQATAIAEQLDDPRQLLWAGVAARFVGDEAAGRAWYGKATARVRELGAVGELPHALEYLAELEMRAGRYGRAIAHATEGLALARDLGQDTSTCRHLATLAFVTALRGEEDACRGHAREALSRAAARGLGLVVAVATHALAMLELGLGRPAAALVHLRAMLAARPGAGSPFLALYCVPDLVEAAARAGDRDGIDEPLAAFERIVGPSGAPGAQAILHRVRAFAADGDPAGAEERFAEALRWSGLADQPFELARTRLLYGEHLRRDKRRTEARGQLRAALEGFDALGAVPWSERARAELRATGETARRRSPDPVVQLTAQERQIVRLVAEGATNQQVGAQLFISKRTVEYHLHNVFTKLGVSSRTALARLPVD